MQYLKLLCQERDLGDEYGWKQIHGDVFRPATHRLLFTALIGTGYHVAIVSLCTITFAIVGELYTEWVVFPGLCAMHCSTVGIVGGFIGECSSQSHCHLLKVVLFTVIFKICFNG